MYQTKANGTSFARLRGNLVEFTNPSFLHVLIDNFDLRTLLLGWRLSVYIDFFIFIEREIRRVS